MSGGMIDYDSGLHGWVFKDEAGLSHGPYASEHEARLARLDLALEEEQQWPYSAEPDSARETLAKRYGEEVTPVERPTVLDFTGLWLMENGQRIRIVGKQGSVWVGDGSTDGHVHEWDADGKDTMDRSAYDLVMRVREGAAYH